MPRGTKFVGSETAREYLKRFPKVATQTLAKKAYKENPALWSTLNACICAFRRLRGAQGHHSRNKFKKYGEGEFYRPHEKPGHWAPKLPEGIKEIKDFSPVDPGKPGNWLVMSDIHLPFHDKRAIELVVAEAKRRGVVGVLLNGDVMDNHVISHWQRDPRKRDYGEEITCGQQFMEYIRWAFPRKDILMKWGNHDERWEIYLMQKAPELLDVPEFQMEEFLHIKKHGIQTVKDRRAVMLGKLWCVHGHEWRGGPSSPVNPARGLYLKAKVSAICGHLHQPSHHSEKDLGEHIVSCWTTGCLCDMHPMYAPYNKWCLGAAFVHVGQDGSFDVTNGRVIHGKFYS